MNRVKEIRNRLTPLFKQEKSIIFVYIFGSTTQGTTNFESDVDIAVYLDKKRAGDFFKKRLFLIEKVQSLLKRPTEIVVLNEVNSIFFKFVIIKEGKVIFERDHGKRVDFELKIMQEYYDFQPFLDEYNKSYLQRSLEKYS